MKSTNSIKYNNGNNIHYLSKKFATDGCLLLPGWFNSKVIPGVLSEFETAVHGNDTGERLRASKFLRTTALDKFLLDIIFRYFNNDKFYFDESYGGCSYFSNRDSEDTTTWWHHDARSSQVKMGILLTDVPSNGQGTEVALRSNKIPVRFRLLEERFGLHRYRSPPGLTHETGSNFYSNDYVANHYTARVLNGPPGTVYLLDTNCLHRGLRGSVSCSRKIWWHCYNGKGFSTAYHIGENIFEPLLSSSASQYLNNVF